MLTRRELLRAMGVSVGAVAVGRPLAVWAQQKPAGPVRIAQNIDIRTWDPHTFFSTWEMTLLEHIYDPLVALEPSGKIVPALAESWEKSADGLTWMFKLRKGVRFHNGQPFTSDDVKATLERIYGNSMSGWAFTLAELDRVEVNGPFSVTVRTKRPLAALLNNLAVTGIIPASAARANRDQRWEDGIGTGPFKAVERVKGERIVLTANLDHWQKGLPKSSGVLFRPMLEDATRVAAIRNKEIDIANFIPLELTRGLASDPTLRLVTDVAWEVHFLGLSCSKPPFNNAQARAALNAAIQRELLVKAVYGGGQPIAVYIVPGLLGYDSGLPTNPYDPAKAKALLKEAGYTGAEIDFIVPQGAFDKSREVSEAITGMMEEAGFKVKMSILETATWARRRSAGDYGMFIIDTEAVTGDPDRFLSERIVNDIHKTGYRNEEVFSLIRQAGSELDSVKRGNLYKRVQRVMLDEPASHIFLYVPVHRHVERSIVQGFIMPPTGLWRADATTLAG